MSSCCSSGVAHRSSSSDITYVTYVTMQPIAGLNSPMCYLLRPMISSVTWVMYMTSPPVPGQWTPAGLVSTNYFFILAQSQTVYGFSENIGYPLEYLTPSCHLVLTVKGQCLISQEGHYTSRIYNPSVLIVSRKGNNKADYIKSNRSLSTVL